MSYCEIQAYDEELSSSFFTSARHADVECHMHLHSSMEIIIVTEGTLHMEIDSIRYSIPKGYAAFVPPFVPHQFHSEYHNRCHVLMFLKEVLPYFNDFVEKNTPKTHLFEVSRECFSLVEHILPLEVNRVDQFPVHAVLGPLVYEISQKCDFSPSSNKRDHVLTDALEYMNLHYTENLTLKNVAKAIGIHPVTLSKCFSRLPETNFSALLNYLRCTHASMLLRNRNLSCTEAAFASGFNCIRSFNRAFQKIYGVSPSQYRDAK